MALTSIRQMPHRGVAASERIVSTFPQSSCVVIPLPQRHDAVRAPRSGTRLTRRGRFAVSGLVTGAALAAIGLFGLYAAAGAQAARSGPARSAVHQHLDSVVVRPGDTLWGIAMRAQPKADARIVIQQIIDLNALGSTGIQPGERLWVPRG